MPKFEVGRGRLVAQDPDLVGRGEAVGRLVVEPRHHLGEGVGGLLDLGSGPE